MMNIMLFTIMLIILFSIPFLINFIISKKTNLNQEKMFPFGCGFNHNTTIQGSFIFQNSIIISQIFLIFDIEIALFLFLIYMSMNFNPFTIFYSFMFLFILIIGLYTEYNEFSLDWKMM